MRGLDPLLDRLEQLALDDVEEVPADIAGVLASVGISAGKVYDAHEAVLDLQEQLQPRQDPEQAAIDAAVVAAFWREWPGGHRGRRSAA